jgi:hypothetical protein
MRPAGPSRKKERIVEFEVTPPDYTRSASILELFDVIPKARVFSSRPRDLCPEGIFAQEILPPPEKRLRSE